MNGCLYGLRIRVVVVFAKKAFRMLAVQLGDVFTRNLYGSVHFLQICSNSVFQFYKS